MALPRYSTSMGATIASAAAIWLNEDEYSTLVHLVEDGEVGVDVAPPQAENDDSLVPIMLILREADA